MKIDQEFTPKYWVLHNKNTDDVVTETLAKSQSECDVFRIYAIWK